MKKSLILIFYFLAIGLSGFGQAFSLKQCIGYANLHNSNIVNSQYDIDISQKKINEQVGSMLPQVDASASYTNNLKMATTILPGEMLGKPGTTIPVTMGTQHNVSAGVQLNQKLFDPSFGIALKAAKISKEQTQQSLQQSTEQTIYSVSTRYYQTLIIQKQINVLQATLDASAKTLASTELKFKNGVAKKIDVDKIRVSYNNTKSMLQQSVLSYKQSLNNLKYQMGMPVDSLIFLTDTTLNIESKGLELGTDPFNVSNRIDYQLQQTTLQLYEADKKRNIAGYLPSLSFVANYNYNAMRKEFNFFDKDQNWFNSNSIGFSLKLPIFDGLQKQAKIAQSKINILKTQENIRHTEQAIKVDISNYEIQYKNALDNIRSERDNLELASSVYKQTQLAYQQGASSSLDLVQDESSFREAQNNYFNKLLNLYIARIDLEKAKGNLIQYINNIQ